MKKILLLASFFFALTSHAQGPSSPNLLIYNSSCSGTFLYNLAAGACLTSGGSGSGNVSNGGNSFGTAMTLGTLDNNYLQFTVNNSIFNYIYPNSSYAAYPYISWGSQPQASTSQTNQYFFYSKSNGSGNDKNYTGLFVESDLDDTTDGTGYQQGVYGVVHSNANTSNYSLLRNYLMAESTGNGTITETYGARALTRIYDANYPTQVSTGTIQNGYGLEVYAHSTSPTAVMQNATGILISHANAGNSAGTGSDSAIHTAYGIHIQNDIAATGSATQNIAYAILSDATVPSVFNGDMHLESHAELRLSDTNYHYINLNAPSSFASTYNITLPTADGTAGQYVKTDGFGNWSWGSPVTGTGSSGYISFWNGTTSQTYDSNFYWDSTNHRLGLGTSVPTNTITYASTSTGSAYYNTSDQVTNFEKIGFSWGSNIFGISTSAGGTGVVRPVQILSGGIGFSADTSASAIVGSSKLNLGFGSTSVVNGPGLVSITGTTTSNTGTQNTVGITTTINQRRLYQT